MNINFNYSGMFSNSSSNSSSFSGLYGLLGEYNNIRSGAYYKVAKEYFITKTEDTSSADKTSSAINSSLSDKLSSLKSNESVKTLATVKEEASDLKDAVSKLTDTGKESLFVEKEKKVKDEKTGEETTVRAIDTEAIQKAVNDYVSEYNETLKAAYNSGDTAVIRNVGYMTRTTETFSRALSEVGITVNKDNTLSIDEEKFSSAKLDNVKTLFNGTYSYAAVVSQKADMITTAATNSAASANTYTNTGAYQYAGYGASALEWYL